MTDLPNTPTNNNSKSLKNAPVRDKKGRFIKPGVPSSPPVVADDKNNIVNQATISSTPPSQSAAPVIGSMAKESLTNVEDIYLQEAERTKELKEQLAQLEKDAEVKEIKGEIELPEMVKKEGVEVIGEETPIPTQPTVVLPMDDTKIYQIVKNFKKLHQSVKDSVTWLAFWCYRQLQLLNIKLKEAGGQVVRQSGSKKVINK